jgi:anthranilate synthase/aminodeoxychorismate synthase-like glutamine amidotransferase
MPADVLVLDNYDSFTHNLVDLLRQFGARVAVRRNDAIDVAEVERDPPRGLVLSPGPGRPEDAGVSVPLVRRFGATIPILGVCLGHQALAVAYGGRVVRATHPLHGTATPVRHAGRGLLVGLPQGFAAARYHSLVVDPRRPGRGLVATAWSPEGEVMALVHERDPVEGVQFHPESHLSPEGPRILAAFLRRTGLHPRLRAGPG